MPRTTHPPLTATKAGALKKAPAPILILLLASSLAMGHALASAGPATYPRALQFTLNNCHTCAVDTDLPPPQKKQNVLMRNRCRCYPRIK